MNAVDCSLGYAGRLKRVLTILLVVFLVSSAAAQQADPVPYAPYPEPGPGYVTDLADMLSDEQEERIEQQLWRVEEETSVEIIVVLIEAMADYPGTPQDSIESFATGLFDAYAIGNMPVNDGVLLLVSRDDRKARIELGKGHGRYRDRDANQIMQGTIVPKFKQGDFAGGVESGVHGLMLEFAGVRAGPNWSLWILLALVPVLGLIAYSLFKSGQRGWGWVVVGILLVVVLALLRILVKVAVTIKNAESSSGGSSSWSSGGYGGGFGGGSSGGGGATGSW